MKKLLFTLFFATLYICSAQAQLNDYKYIIVPKKFDAFKKENQYLTSTLVKHLFVKYGFNAVYEDALPEDLNNNRCLGLTAYLNNESSMFVTKASVVLKDCKMVEVYSTQQGSSKEKDFKLSYGEALRESFKSLEGIDYAYKPVEATSEPVTVSFKNDVKQLDKTEVEKTPEKELPEVQIMEKKEGIQQETTPEQQSYKDLEPKTSEMKKAEPSPEEMALAGVQIREKKEEIQQEATPEQQSYKNMEPQPSEIKKAEPDPDPVLNAAPATAVQATDVWYAQPIPNGYQLVDNAPKVRLKMFKSSIPDIYLAKNEKANGMVFKRNGQWYFEYYDGDNLVAEELKIKF